MKCAELKQNLNCAQNNSVSEDCVIDVNISDVILTPLTCASIVNEILKGLLYQKSQIPYPYNFLKSLVDKKRKQTVEENKPINFTAVNHYRIVSSAYDTIEKVTNEIIKEFSENSSHIKEVIVVFGTTPQCPKEVFTINISCLANDHLEINHVNQLVKFRQKILRNIFLSQDWMDAIDASSVCTNTYVYLKKHVSDEDENRDNFFCPTKPLSFPSKLKHVKILLNSDHSRDINCCRNLSVFEDNSESGIPTKRSRIMTSENIDLPIRWYQSKDLLRGFKDCYVNKVSVSELW
ncbi:hypothetical protein NQ317_010912 [Molorchus minor]|uniref:MAD2L1-binding protein n=1 Tax=Molorchus minor TaxID=1323400 RepID=A0ABQ9J827_9CUCU|nr:hypothetical protein NQ317_010912 [Molorchus minor]